MRSPSPWYPILTLSQNSLLFQAGGWRRVAPDPMLPPNHNEGGGWRTLAFKTLTIPQRRVPHSSRHFAKGGRA